MRNPLSEKIVTIKPSGIRKFFDIVNEMDDAISLGVGEPDFDTPWHIRDEGIYSLEKGRTFYTSNAGLKELKTEICRYLKRRFDLEYDPAHEVLVTVGGSEAIDIALRAMVDPGDEVLIPQPSYVSYEPDRAGAAGCHNGENQAPCAPLPQQPHGGRDGKKGSGGDRGGDPGKGSVCDLR